MKEPSKTALKLQAKCIIKQYVEYAEKLFFEDESVLNDETGKGRAGGETPSLSQACPHAFEKTEDIPWN